MLQENSLIASLSISQWTGRRHDKKVSNEVHTIHAASNDAGRYNKQLVAKEFVEPINKIVGRARDFHYSNTLSWGDNNERLLPTKNYFDYITEMGKMKVEFDDAVRIFLSNYDSVISEAKTRLSSMFNEKDYPSKAEIESKFNFRTTFMPVPDNDIRVGLQDDEVSKLRLSIEEEITNRLSGAMGDIWQRIKEQVTHIKDKMMDQESIFRDSLFSNLRELIILLPKLNVTNDKNIAAACKDMGDLLEDPNTVRNNPALRLSKARQAENMINKFKSFF